MVQLPQELILNILEQGYYKDHKRHRPVCDYQTLCYASLVCKTWQGPSQMLLFRSVRLSQPHDHHSMRNFRETVYSSTPRGKTLASLIRQVHIHIGTDPLLNCLTSDFVDVINHCPRLYSVALHADPAVHTFDPSVRDELQQAQSNTSTPIQALDIESCGVQSPILYQLLLIWPSIRFLRLGPEIAALPPITLPKVQLYELVLHRNIRYRQMEWILSSTRDTLRILDIPTALATEFDKLIAQHSEHLVSLRIFHHTYRTPSIIKICPRLKELIITKLSTFLTLGQPPESVEHLSFRCMSWGANVALGPIIDVVDKLPNLRLISCDLKRPAQSQVEDVVRLKQKCNERGIVMRDDEAPFWTREDPVPLVNIPRGYGVGNLRLMSNIVT